MPVKASNKLIYGIVLAVYIIFLGVFALSDLMSPLILLMVFPVLLTAVLILIYFPGLYSLFLFLLLPVSLNVETFLPGFGLSIPAEPLTFILSFLIIINVIRKPVLYKSFFRHPLSIAILSYGLWLVLTSVTSTISLVSVKFLIMQLNFILAFYIGIPLMAESPEKFMRLIKYFSISLGIIVIYVFIRMAKFSFAPEVNFWVVRPFFKDHTIYGATLAMVIPVVLAIFISEKQKGLKYLWFVLFLLLLTGVFISFSRAAWLSLLFLSFVGVWILVLRVKPFKIAVALLIIVLGGFVWRHPILEHLQNIGGQRGGNVVEHLESSADIESAASNVERINRWDCAIQMFKNKPMLGYGPGTFAFQYAPFQKQKYMTKISTWYGDRGGAHSEYLQALSESGLPGFLMFFIIILLSFRTGLSVSYNHKSKQARILSGALVLGLLTFYIHAAVNNFLDTDKISALVWGFTGILVQLDIQMKSENDT